MNEIVAHRLILRRWRPGDLDSFAALNADPRVMQFYPRVLSRSETEEMVRTIEQRIDRDGFGLWAAELRETGALIGAIGLNVPGYPLPFSPCVEIAWKLAFDYWGKGYAQEGARASLAFGFGAMNLREIVAFTSEINIRSRRVMERIGMTYDAQGDFDHPHVPERHPLRRHVLYRQARATA